MKRIIKFRAYSHTDKAFHYFDVYEGYPTGIYGAMSEPEQFTGLKDKYNFEIFEGDIIKFGLTIFMAKFCNYRAKFHGSLNKNLWYLDEDLFTMKNENNFEIIGNIHQNPELLKF